MKKLLAFSLALVLALSLTACNIKFNGGNNTSGTPSGGNPTGTSGAAGATGTAKPNKDGSLDMAATPDGNNGFVCATKDGSGFGVQWPGGAFGGNTQLHMSPITAKLNGIVTPGFSVEDKSNPGQHVKLSQPATIIFYSKDELPDNVVIVKYTDDMKNYMEVPSQGFMTDKGYFIVAEVDSFSSYGVGATDGDDVVIPTDGFVCRMEAEEHDIRMATPGTKSDDLDIFLRADSKVFPAGSQLTFPRDYTGLFDMNEYAMVDNSTKPPMVMNLHVSDPSVKITMIPALLDLNRDDLKNELEQWDKAYTEMADYLNALWKQDILTGIEAGEILEQWKQENPKPVTSIYYNSRIGWGVAHCQYDLAQTSAGGGKTSLTLDIPIIIYVDPSFDPMLFVGIADPNNIGTAMFNGNCGFVGVSAAAPPALHDPAKEYTPEKPFKQPTKFPPGYEEQLKNSIKTINSLQDNSKVPLSDGGWVSAKQLGGEKVDKTETDAFFALWDKYVGMSH